MSSTDNIGTRTAARRRRRQQSTSILGNGGGGGALNSSRNNGHNNDGAGDIIGSGNGGIINNISAVANANGGGGSGEERRVRAANNSTRRSLNNATTAQGNNGTSILPPTCIITKTSSDGSAQLPIRTTMERTHNTRAMSMPPDVLTSRNNRFASLTAAAAAAPGVVDTSFVLSGGKLLQQAIDIGALVHRSDSAVRKEAKLPLVDRLALSYKNEDGEEKTVLYTSLSGQDITDRLKDDTTLLNNEETMAMSLGIEGKSFKALQIFLERNSGRLEEDRKGRSDHRKGSSNASSATTRRFKFGDSRRRLADVLLVTHEPGVFHPVHGIGWVDGARLPFEEFLRARADEKVAATHWSGLSNLLLDVNDWSRLIEVVSSTNQLAGDLNNNPTSPATLMFLTAYNVCATAVRSLDSRVQLEVLKTTLATALSTAGGIGQVVHSLVTSVKDLQKLDWEETARKAMGKQKTAAPSYYYYTNVRFISPGANPKSAFYATPKSSWPLLKMAMKAVSSVLNTCGMFDKKKTVEIRGIVIGICKFMTCYIMIIQCFILSNTNYPITSE